MMFEWRFVDHEGVLVHSETHPSTKQLPTHTSRFGKAYRLVFASAKTHEAEFRGVEPGGLVVE